MSDLRIIQYLPLTHPRATLKFVKRLGAVGVMSILDLEDSVQDPFDLDRTRDLKRNARSDFSALVRSKIWTEDEFQAPIYIRVNSNFTEFFEDDIETIMNIVGSGFPLKGVFLPMVESYTQIEKLHGLLSNKSRKNSSGFSLEIVPMIETANGMDSLPDILENDSVNNLFSKFHYGHFDYCLDANLWPFPDPNHESFWALIKPMVRLALNYNKTYIHTPFPFPNDIDLFWSSSRYLQSLFPQKNIWTCTLNSELSFSREPNNSAPLEIVASETSTDYKQKEAQIIKENFRAGRANKRSFGVSNSRFIPPHQFFAAEKYLQNEKEK